MADSFGIKLGIEGEKEFKKALSEINQSFKVLGSEMKLATSQFDKNENSIECRLFLWGIGTALIDETVQLFVEGRAGLIKDVWIDLGGFCFGVLAIWAAARIKSKSSGK